VTCRKRGKLKTRLLTHEPEKQRDKSKIKLLRRGEQEEEGYSQQERERERERERIQKIVEKDLMGAREKLKLISRGGKTMQVI
jgi:hypothetical protein